MAKINREVVEMLARPVDVKKLVDGLFFDIDDLEMAGLKQPKLFLESGRFRAQMAMQLASYKRKMSRLTGKKSLKIRKSHNGLTETAIKTRLSMNSEIQSLQKQCDNFEVYEDFAKDLREAYKERLMVIAVLARLRGSEMSSELRQVKSEEDMDRLRRRAKKVREKFDDLGDDND